MDYVAVGLVGLSENGPIARELGMISTWEVRRESHWGGGATTDLAVHVDVFCQVQVFPPGPASS